MNSKHYKYLIVGPAWVGDMVMAQTLFILLKQRQPQCVIDVLAPEWSRPLLARMPEVNKAISLPIGHGKLALAKRYAIAKSLRGEHYDEAILLPNSFKSALIPFFANIPKRTGWLGEYRYLLLNNIHYLHPKKWPLMVQRFMQLALQRNEQLPGSLPKPRLQVNQQDVMAAIEKYHLQVEGETILALCPGAEFGEAKRWPAEHYASIANEKLKQGWQVWLLGSKKDAPVAQSIQSATQNRCVDLTGKTSLADAIDLLSLATLVVSNDSGLMHIASSLNKKLIVVYGSTSPMFTPPLCDQVRILNLELSCSPCFKRVCPLGHTNCLQNLTPDLVLNASADLLAAG